MKVGIVGVGYVGTALKEGFKEYHQVETYDLDTNLSSCNSIDELVEKTELIFLCVPTPMHKNGSCDLSIVKGSIEKDEKSIMVSAIIITFPKSITGFISENNKEPNATIVVKEVYKQG